MDLLKKYNLWLNNCKNDAELYEELLSVKDKPDEIEERFYKNLEFGTGGLRGIIGAGTNRMNIFTVGKATMGLANYINKQTDSGSAVIAYDSRNKSREFAFRAAAIFSSQNIAVYIFNELTPTPVLSYAVRKLKATAGIVITASHNPKIYNGYKVYNGKGCQITDEAADDITKQIQKIDNFFSEVKPNSKFIKIIDNGITDGFINTVLKLRLFSECELYSPSVVYTPLNGTGNKPVREVLKKIGIRNLFVVSEQENPNPDFTTCPYPNPEEKEALSLAVKLGEEKNAELILATDPDADRVGIAVRKKNGEYRLMSGNETGCILENYILSRKKELGILPDNPVIIKTIVTTDMAVKIADFYGAQVKEVLTGFKYIGEQIDNLDDKSRFVFGLEESYGYLAGTHARDKDAVSASMLICEAAAYYKSLDKSLTDVLEELYKKYGYYKTKLVSVKYDGIIGNKKMKEMIESVRKNPWKEIGGKTVNCFKDYLRGLNGLPGSDVLSFSGENFKIILRPSGTEPKLKIYFTVNGKIENETEELIKTLISSVDEKLN